MKIFSDITIIEVADYKNKKETSCNGFSLNKFGSA